MEETHDFKTKDFLKKIELLIERGLVKNHAQVVNDLHWNKSVMSSVKNGNLPVPLHVYNKFKEVYADELAELMPATNTDPYKDRYIQLLEKQVAERDAVLKDMELKYERLQASLIEITEAIKMNQVYARTLFHSVAEHRSAQEKVPLKKMQDEMGKALAAASREVFQD